MFHTIVVHGHGVGVKGTGLQNIRTCLKILAVNTADDVRLGQQQQVVVAFDINGMVGKSTAFPCVTAKQLGAAIMRFGQLVTLDHRTHRAVQYQDALLNELFDRVMGHGGGLN